jgi:hypothetical protein
VSNPWRWWKKGGETAAILLGLYKTVYMDEDEKLTREDADEIFWAALALGWVWSDVALMGVSTTALAPVAGVIVLGGVASYGIGGKSGFDDYVSVMTGDVSPEEYYDVVSTAIESEVIEPIRVEIEETITITTELLGMGWRSLKRNLGLGWKLTRPRWAPF